MSPVCQRPGASSARRDVSLRHRVCETTGHRIKNLPHVYTQTHLNHLIYVIGVCVREARPPYCNRSLRVWLTHTHRGMLLARRHTGAGSVARKQRGERESGSVCVNVVRRFHPPIAHSNPAGPQSSRARFSFVSWAIFDSLLGGLRFSFDGRHQVVPLAQPRASFRARDGGCGEIAHPLSPSHPKRTCVVQEQDMHANPDP